MLSFRDSFMGRDTWKKAFISPVSTEIKAQHRIGDDQTHEKQMLPTPVLSGSGQKGSAIRLSHLAPLFCSQTV